MFVYHIELFIMRVVALFFLADFLAISCIKDTFTLWKMDCYVLSLAVPKKNKKQFLYTMDIELKTIIDCIDSKPRMYDVG